MVERGVVLLEGGVDSFAVAGKTGILDCLCLLTEGVDVLGGEVFELTVGLLRASLIEDKVLQKFEVLLR